MAKTDYKSVDEYIAAQPEAAQGVLRQVRESIRKVLPEAEEIISYQIPAYKTKAGRPVYFSGWKKHYSLYPATARLTAAFKDELTAYEVEKGTIRFPLSAPVPKDLIRRMALFRANEVEEEAKAKAAAAAAKKER